MRASNLVLAALSAATAAAAPTTPSAGCTRELLAAHVETYISAQVAGKPDAIAALAAAAGAAKFEYTEDAKPLDVTKGVLTLALRPAHNRSIYDTTQCATYTELIVTDAPNPRVVGTQMRFDAASPATTLLKMESLVTQEGDWAFNATGTLFWATREDGMWGAIPEADRDSRATIQAAADAYMDLFQNKSTVVPWGTPCDRLEGSMYTGNGSLTDSCNVGVPDGVNIHNRRYVIDEVLGTVDAFVTFQTRPDSHEFRVEKGKLRFVHTLTIMRD